MIAMKYYTSTTQFNCGIDLHARQMYVCLMDRDGKKLVHTNIKNNDFDYFLKLIAPYRHDLTICCECMFGWYWLADACQAAGLHFVLAQKQNLLNYHAPLPLAETASVFGEMLLTRALLDKESDPTVRRSLLCAKIEDIIATTFRQTVLTRFELRLHAERMNGLLSSDRIGEIWLEENGRLFGDAVEMIPAYRWGWSYISHFIHTRFYCYSYTFAELMVLALFQKYREEGDSFKPGYRRLLESGGALSPADTAQLAGIDINEGDFWQKGYDFLGGLIAELKESL